jgi:hypothetical protein
MIVAGLLGLIGVLLLIEAAVFSMPALFARESETGQRAAKQLTAGHRPIAELSVSHRTYQQGG